MSIVHQGMKRTQPEIPTFRHNTASHREASHEEASGHLPMKVLSSVVTCLVEELEIETQVFKFQFQGSSHYFIMSLKQVKFLNDI